MIEFYGTDDETYEVRGKSIYLIQSVDWTEPRGPEKVKRLPKDAVRLNPELVYEEEGEE